VDGIYSSLFIRRAIKKIVVDVNVIDQILISRLKLEKKWDYDLVVYQLLIDFMKTNDLIAREVLYNILIQFGMAIN
jgi:hypothetical protein